MCTGGLVRVYTRGCAQPCDCVYTSPPLEGTVYTNNTEVCYCMLKQPVNTVIVCIMLKSEVCNVYCGALRTSIVNNVPANVSSFVQ